LITLRRRAWNHFRSKIGEQLSDPAILGKLKNNFEDKFRYDAAGVPRVWGPGDDIDAVFRVAKEEVGTRWAIGLAGWLICALLSRLWL
jgi:hypothetical protein